MLGYPAHLKAFFCGKIGPRVHVPLIFLFVDICVAASVATDTA